MTNHICVKDYTDESSVQETMEARCSELVRKAPGVRMGILLKRMERRAGVTRNDALEGIQSALDAGLVRAEEMRHNRTGKRFLAFFPV